MGLTQLVLEPIAFSIGLRFIGSYSTHCLLGGYRGGRGEGARGAGYVSLASHNFYPIIVYSVPRNRLLLSHS